MKKWQSIWIIIFGILFCNSSFAGVRFGLNDLTILLPLPANQSDVDALLKTTDGVTRSPLLKPAWIDQLPQFIINDPDPELRKKQLRLIAIRFDPCFMEGDAPAPCRRQIRLVFQPIGLDQKGFFTFDVSIHVFYDFTKDEWNRVLEDWAKTAVGTPEEPLQIHPQIRREGLRGPHWQKIRDLVLRHCHFQNATRVTSSTTNNFGMQWTFTGIDIDQQGQVRHIKIPRTDKLTQVFFLNLENLNEFVGAFFPAPTGETDLIGFIKNSVAAKKSMSENQLLAILSRTLDFENPRKFNPGNLDCVSCHIAQTTRLWGERNINDWQQSKVIQNSMFISRWNLQNTSVQPLFTNRVRALGYFSDQPAFSQRVINETTMVADQFQRTFSK